MPDGNCHQEQGSLINHNTAVGEIQRRFAYHIGILPAGGGTFLFRQESTQRMRHKGGSDPPAASGGKRKGSEWQWSIADEGGQPRRISGTTTGARANSYLLRCPVCALVTSTCVAHRPRLLVRVASSATGSAPLTPPYVSPAAPLLLLKKNNLFIPHLYDFGKVTIRKNRQATK